MSNQDPPFFVGYLPIPKRLRRFLACCAAVTIVAFIVTAMLFGGAQDEPQASGFRFDYGRQTVTGVIEITPYPLLRVTEGNDLIKPGKTLLLTSAGKTGVDQRAMGMDGEVATVTGIVLQRGTIDMLQVVGGRRGFSFVEDAVAPEMETEPLGRWKLAGEICDGKCLNGAMRPGRGLAHKACANLCLIGEVPPVFVSTQLVEGSDFMVMTGPDGTRLPQEAYDFVGQFVTLEGELERRGDILVLRLDPATLALIP